MPANIKIAIACLVLSFVAMLIADYVDSLYLEGYDLFLPLIAGVNLVWGAVMVWIISDIYRKKNIATSLYVVGAIMVFFLASSVIDDGFTPSQLVSLLEILLFLAPIYFLKKPDAKLWYSSTNS